MQVPALVWALTIFGILSLLVFDYRFHVRKAHVPSMAEAATWSAVYIGLAIAFGVGVTVAGGTNMGSQYFAGYVTEKALSADNLFVFLLIMTSLKVPRPSQQKALLFGIAFSLIARTGFILIGAALISSFAWVFYFFGLILFVTAIRLLTPTRAAGPSDNFAIRFAKRLSASDESCEGDKLFTTVDKHRRATPLLLTMIAIGATDVLFALDSIPAIFGLTQNVYLVITATAFSLLGLRQLYFVIDGLLDRLVYLSYGLAAILGFIGVKLVLHALHENNLAFVNHGRPVAIVEVGTSLSLGVVIGILLVTVGASLTVRRRSELGPGRPESVPTPAIECVSEPQLPTQVSILRQTISVNTPCGASKTPELGLPDTHLRPERKR
jgi:tellurite resistance protein TerC